MTKVDLTDAERVLCENAFDFLKDGIAQRDLRDNRIAQLLTPIGAARNRYKAATEYYGTQNMYEHAAYYQAEANALLALWERILKATSTRGGC